MRFSAFTFVFMLFFSGVMGQSPEEIPGLELWLRADSALELNVNQVSTWFDLSTNENHLTQDINNYRPTLTPEALNGHRSIFFDGANDRMLFDEIANARTIFWVLREAENPPNGFGPLLGHETTFPFFRGPEREIWHPQFTNIGIREGNTKMNFVSVDGVQSDLAPGPQILSLTTTSNQLCSKFGQDRTINNFWRGELFELIIFSTVLSEAEVSAVENYLADYYAQDPAIIDDVSVENSVCPIEFQAPAGFSNYLWSTGETGENVFIQGEGSLWLETIDDFGRTRRDSAFVDFPGSLAAPNDTTICANGSFSWESNLSLLDFSLVWNDASTSNSITSNQNDTIFCLVSDNFGCSYVTDSCIVSISGVDEEVFILGDGDQCQGNSLSLDDAGYDLQNVLWQDTTPGESFLLNTSGTYWFQASDELGCIARDTVEVNIIGVAPEVNILGSAPFCTNSEELFESEVLGDENIATYSWILNGNEISQNSEVNFEFTQSGENNITLSVMSDVGCSNSAQLNFQVHPTPENNSIFTGSNCANNPMFWTLLSDFDTSDLQEVTWTIEGELYSGVQITPEIENSGFIPVEVNLLSNQACAATLNSFVEVLPQAEVDFSASGFCFGDLTSFSPEINMPQGQEQTTLQWSFGDGGVSGQINALHFYPNPGTYDVDLIVFSDAGCQSTASGIIEIYDLPNIAIPAINACEFESLVLPTFEGQSNDPISAWSWDVASLGSFDEATPEIQFESSGYYNIELNVETENQCAATSFNVITVFPSPLVDFSFTPEIGLPPIEIQFINSSEPGLSYSWVFGDEGSSTEASPTVVFENEGLVEVALTGTSSLSCSNTQTYTIELIEPLSDLVIEFLSLDETPLGYQVNALVVNNSNYRSTQRSMSVQNGTGPAFVQLDDEVLNPGQSKIFTFDLLASGVTDQAPYICVEVAETAPLSSELTPQDNRTCISETNTFRVLDPYPNPCSDRVRFRFISPAEGSARLKVYNSQGELVFESEAFAVVSGFQEQSLDVSGYSQGVYLYELELMNSVQTGQISVVR